jgi:hypothetical protein
MLQVSSYDSLPVNAFDASLGNVDLYFFGIYRDLIAKNNLLPASDLIEIET